MIHSFLHNQMRHQEQIHSSLYVIMSVNMLNTSIFVTGDDLVRCVDLYNQSQSKWFEEIVTTSLVRDHPSGVMLL